MIFQCHHVESTVHLFQNYQAQREGRAGYPAFLEALWEGERRTLEFCRPALRLDARLGLQLEDQSYFVSAGILEKKLA